MIKQIAAMTVSAITLFGGAMMCAHALEPDMDPDQIISLANSAELTSSSGGVDEAGRPLVVLGLRYANSCYARVGSEFLMARAGDGPGHVIVNQLFPDEGCPDIFQPVDQSEAVLLPGAWGRGEVRVVARGAAGMPYVTIAMDGAPKLDGARVTEGRDLMPGKVFSGLKNAEIVSEGDGVVVAGTLAVTATCGTDRVSTMLFEVPDSSGTSIGHVLAIGIDSSCPETDERQQVSIRLPETAKRETVYVVNETAAGSGD